MFRFSAIVCVSLIFGITAKPYKPWNKLTYEALQDTVMSKDDKGKMSWEMQVEPPEDMDETDFDIGPRMMIWKSMKSSGQDERHLMAEEDLDELYHPSMADLNIQTQNLDALPVADVQAESGQEDANMKYNQEPEKDNDDIDHPVYQVQHSPVQMEPLGHEVWSDGEVRIYPQPEEDKDHLYHKDVQQLVPFEAAAAAAAAAAADVPSQRKHNEPEDDLDYLYHQ